MAEFRKFLSKYHNQIIAAQLILIFGAVIQQQYQEEQILNCKSNQSIKGNL